MADTCFKGEDTMRFAVALLFLLGPLPAALCQQSDGPRPEARSNDRTARVGLEGKQPPPLNGVNWANTGGKPLTWSDLRGKVVLLSFWEAHC